ncbi:MAG: ACP S-malonyltransferase [Desulfovibrionaceae bacterium]
MTIDTTTAVLFPGQGSQEPGMGRDLADASREAMELWKKAEKASGARLREIYWDGGDEAAMAQTRYLQPALTVVNLNLWAHVADRVKPVAMAGHSLGEFSALAASGALSVDRTLEAVSLRGRLMAEADPDGKGAMAALLKLSQGQVEEVAAAAAKATGELCIVANYNSPAQYVISGTVAAIEAASGMVKEFKGRAVRLPVSGAFHSPLMDEAAAELASFLKKLDWNRPKTPVCCNVTAAPETDADALRGLMCRQMTSSVRWIEIIAGQYASGVRRFVEVGPKGVLTKLLKANLGDHDDWSGENLGNKEQADAF